MNTNGKVISPPQFAAKMDAETLAGLQEQGMLIKEASVIDEIELDDPKYGEDILGTLTEEETKLFVNYHAASAEMDDLHRACGSNLIIKAGEAIRDKKEKDFDTSDSIVEEEAYAFFQKQRQVDVLKSLLFWYIGERLDCHDHVLGIRSKRRIIKGQRKW